MEVLAFIRGQSGEETMKMPTQQDIATPINRPVYMIFRSANLNPVIDARTR